MAEERWLILASAGFHGELLASRVPIVKETDKSYIVDRLRAEKLFAGGTEKYYIPTRVDKVKDAHMTFFDPYAVGLWFIKDLGGRIEEMLARTEKLYAQLEHARVLFEQYEPKQHDAGE